MLKAPVVLATVTLLLGASATVLWRETHAAGLPSAAAAGGPLAITVYHSPTCTCCTKWIKHLKENGFEVTSIEQEDLSALKKEHGVTGKLVSCHTARIGQYVIEGHVPAADIVRLLREKPAVAGLTAPGMPQSAPGMDAAGQPYEVLTFDRSGDTKLWAHH